MNTDLIIIGAGPVGLYGAFYAGLRGINAVVIDSLDAVGGQLTALYPEKYIYDIPAQPKVLARDLISLLEEQANQFSEFITYRLKEDVIGVEKVEERNFIVKTTKETYHSKAILIAAGGGAFNPRKLGLENEDQFKNIKYSINNLKELHGKKVAIFGGGDSAVDWSLMLKDDAEVSVIHRRDEFRAKEATVAQMKESSVNVYTPYVATNLIGDGDTLKQIELEHAETKERKIIDVDYAVVNFGFTSSIGPIKDWNLELDKTSVVVDSHQKTSVDGIYAIGNICSYPGKIKLITVGLGEAPIAMNEIKLYIDPSAKNVVQYSSNLFKK